MALKRATIAEGKKHMGTHDVNGGSQQDSVSSLDCHTRNRFRAFLRSEANHIWEVGKKLGLVSTQNKYEVLHKLVEMDVGDR